MIYVTRGEDANHYATDAVALNLGKIFVSLLHILHPCFRFSFVYNENRIYSIVFGNFVVII
jgi:hypothetical protein